MGQEPGGTLNYLDGATGIASVVPVPDANTSPFLNQVRAFARALETSDHADFSLERDLHTMRLLERAYAGANDAGHSGSRPAAWPDPEPTQGTA
jgi:hypothetical protein